jgi:hypothetical protein
MVSEIAENIPHQFISIRHKGMLDGDIEILEGPAIEAWAGSTENYSFEEENGHSHVSVELYITEEYKPMFDSLWPKALDKLKEICERG